MLYGDRSRAESFGKAAERYDRSRPTYPPALVDELIGDQHEPAVVDVGCGTGIAAALLAGRGARVLGVEVDPLMAEVARSKGIDVEVSAFETWDAAGRAFDMVTAAQSWHWVDPLAGPEKAAAVLRPGGRIGLFWNMGSHDADLQAALEEVYARVAPGTDRDAVSINYNNARDRMEVQWQGLTACEALTEFERREFPWERTYTTGQWLDQLPTHSDHAALPPQTLASLLDDVAGVIDSRGGSFVMHYRTLLMSARRR